MVTKSSGSIQTTKSKPGQSCHLCALPNNAAATGNAENDLGMTESSDVSQPPQGTPGCCHHSKAVSMGWYSRRVSPTQNHGVQWSSAKFKACSEGERPFLSIGRIWAQAISECLPCAVLKYLRKEEEDEGSGL